MKRALLENNKVLLNPQIVDRSMFLSAIFALKATGDVAEETTVSLKFEHCDTEDGTFELVKDTEICPSKRLDKDTGMIEGIEIEADEDVNIDLDLLGCKQYVKITVTFKNASGEDTEISSLQAIVLGDSTEVPV